MWSYVHIYFKTLENWRSSKDWEEKQKRSVKGEDWEDGSLDEIMPCIHEDRCSDLHEYMLCSHEDQCWDFLALCNELTLAVSVLGGRDRMVPGLLTSHSNQLAIFVSIREIPQCLFLASTDTCTGKRTHTHADIVHMRQKLSRTLWKIKP